LRLNLVLGRDEETPGPGGGTIEPVLPLGLQVDGVGQHEPRAAVDSSVRQQAGDPLARAVGHPGVDLAARPCRIPLVVDDVHATGIVTGEDVQEGPFKDSAALAPQGIGHTQLRQIASLIRTHRGRRRHELLVQGVEAAVEVQTRSRVQHPIDLY